MAAAKHSALLATVLLLSLAVLVALGTSGSLPLAGKTKMGEHDRGALSILNACNFPFLSSHPFVILMPFKILWHKQWWWAPSFPLLLLPDCSHAGPITTTATSTTPRTLLETSPTSDEDHAVASPTVATIPLMRTPQPLAVEIDLLQRFLVPQPAVLPVPSEGMHAWHTACKVCC